MIAHGVQLVHCVLHRSLRPRVVVVAVATLLVAPRMLPRREGTAQHLQTVVVPGFAAAQRRRHLPSSARRHIGTHVEALQGKIHAGLQLAGGQPGGGRLAEPLEMDDKDVGDGPDAQSFDRLPLLVALRTVVGVLLAQLLFARILAAQRKREN